MSENKLEVQDTKVTQNRKVKDIEKTSNPFLIFLWLLIPLFAYIIYKLKWKRTQTEDIECINQLLKR